MVCAQLGTELHKSRAHLSLLMLERMRLIDQANAWAKGMHQNYQAGLQHLQSFEWWFGVTLLCLTPLSHPPCHPSITIMWAQQHYALNHRLPSIPKVMSMFILEPRGPSRRTNADIVAYFHKYEPGHRHSHTQRVIHEPRSV